MWGLALLRMQRPSPESARQVESLSVTTPKYGEQVGIMCCCRRAILLLQHLTALAQILHQAASIPSVARMHLQRLDAEPDRRLVSVHGVTRKERGRCMQAFVYLLAGQGQHRCPVGVSSLCTSMLSFSE